MKRIVLDTNVLLVSVSDRSPHHWVFKGLIDGENANFIVTEDKDFKAWKEIDFPRVEIRSIQEFQVEKENSA